MLSSEERLQIVSALRVWAENAPDEPVFGTMLNLEQVTPMELLRDVENEKEIGKLFLEILEHSVRREGLERVTQRFMGRLEQ